ncbi:HlyD family type I secretion periplasmic adaptor subunit [Rhizobium mayense]|uniref:Membrane fusion protein (MFP) family protein n=1 Tax=Rhizobium mayense TaxID=1312184 RepID=A0ABT7K5C1_9HYPH|nr:HlyD family type I secretion periplasmic adaptor subunit [Rhizobium mayense]MDL2403810.1 HlyD family type I secretion periplasmic adaptor subunit [Rhizobium mayense]
MDNLALEGQDNKVDRKIAAQIARDRRPTTQIGSDVDYERMIRAGRNLLIAIVALVSVLIVLSIFVKVEEVARARGEFVPVRRLQVIQTAEGGLLEDILVRNDDRVTKGQVIARFRATDLLRDIQLSEVRIARLQIEIERLGALAEGRQPNLDQFRDKYPELVNEALALHKQTTERLQADLNQRDHAIDEVRVSLDAAERQIPSAQSSLRATQELLDRTRAGAQNEVITRSRVAQVEEQTAQSERTYIQLVTSLDELKARIRSLQAERTSLIAKTTGDARNERGDRLEQLNEANVTLGALRNRAEGIEVRAPVNGIVHKVSETPIGTVIPAGGTVCEVVPTDGGVLMQVRVAPRDIGFVHIGQKALVKADAFEYGRFGAIQGDVVRIAPSSTTAQSGQEPFFPVEVVLQQAYVGADKSHVVTPGMTGEASILTGEKTIFQYLLKPIYVTLQSAMSER